VLILSDNPGVITAMERIDGFKEIMAQHPGIKLVEQISNGTRDTHQKTTENMLTAHPDIDAIFCFDGDHTLGAYAALQGLGNKKTLIAGYDASPEQIAIMKKEGAKCQIISSVALFRRRSDGSRWTPATRLSGEKITGSYTRTSFSQRGKNRGTRRQG
jgi:ribose transport system substrate-binding protein